MYPITTDTAVDGEFTDGDESQGIPPTDLNALWFNTIQREFLSILDGMGIAPDVANFAQIWDVLKRLGVRCNYYNGDVSTSDFDGHQVILHTCADFTLNALKTNSVVIVIPYWSADSDPAKITMTYKNSSYKYDIPKGSILIGLIKNGVSPYSQLLPRYIPFAYNGRDLNIVGKLNAGGVVADKRYEKGFLIFENSDTPGADGLEPWRSWQLAENWEVGQVRRVYCSNAANAPSVYVYYNTAGNYKAIKFAAESFREFVCIGTHTETINDVSYEFAALVVNG